MKSLTLIDLSAIFWAAWHATAEQELSAAFELTVGKVHQLAGDDELAAVCCDAPPYTRRKALLPTYKSNREAAPPNAIGQLKRVKERLVADGFVLWDVPGFESDDVIATACALAAREEEPLSITIATADKDLCQLVDDTMRISWKSTNDGQRRGEKEVAEKFGVPPKLMLDYLALTGDKSDNVPGIPGVGPKNAAKLLERFGDLEGVLAGAAEITQPALKKNLTEHAEAARLAARVIVLATDVPIDFDAVFAERTPKPLAPSPTPEELDAIDEDEETHEDPLLDEVMPGTSPAKRMKTIEMLASPQGDEPPIVTQEQARRLVAHESTPAPVVAPAVQKAAPPKAELAIVQQQPFEMQLQPRSIGQVASLARGIANSRLYSKFTSEDAITTVILRGRELGLSAMTSLDVFHVVEGKPVLHAHLIIDRARRHPDCEYFRYVGGDHTFAEWECKHRDNPAPTRLKYTIQQAERAGLVKPGGNWAKRPEEMLRKTCAVQLSRIDFPGAALGLYAVEELAPDHESVGAAA